MTEEKASYNFCTTVQITEAASHQDNNPDPEIYNGFEGLFAEGATSFSLDFPLTAMDTQLMPQNNANRQGANATSSPTEQVSSVTEGILAILESADLMNYLDLHASEQQESLISIYDVNGSMPLDIGVTETTLPYMNSSNMEWFQGSIWENSDSMIQDKIKDDNFRLDDLFNSKNITAGSSTSAVPWIAQNGGSTTCFPASESSCSAPNAYFRPDDSLNLENGTLPNLSSTNVLASYPVQDPTACGSFQGDIYTNLAPALPVIMIPEALASSLISAQPCASFKRKRECESQSDFADLEPKVSQTKKTKLYNEAPSDDVEREKKRKAAVKSKEHRIKTKNKMSALTQERDYLRSENAMLKQRMEAYESILRQNVVSNK